MNHLIIAIFLLCLWSGWSVPEDKVGCPLRPRRRHLWRVLREDPHWKCMVLTILLNASVVVILWCRFSYKVYPQNGEIESPCREGYTYIPAAFFVLLYTVYLVECWHSQTRLAICYKEDVHDVYLRVRTLRSSFPVVWWRAISYHYSRYTRQITHYRHGDTFTSTQEVYQRINTHSAAGAFDFSVCGVKDVSTDIGGLEDHPLTRIAFSKNFMFLNEQAENDYLSQRARFFAEHEERDENMETREGLGLTDSEYIDDMICYASSEKLPKYICLPLFWIFSIFLLSWPYRLIVSLNTSVMDYQVEKLFGCNYASNMSSMEQWDGESIQNIPAGFFIGSQHSLESLILGNRQLAPSYSEAVLMDKLHGSSIASVDGPRGPGPPQTPRTRPNIGNGRWATDPPLRRSNTSGRVRTVPNILQLFRHNSRTNFSGKQNVRRAVHSWSNFRDIRSGTPAGTPTSMHSHLVPSRSGLALVSLSGQQDSSRSVEQVNSRPSRSAGHSILSRFRSNQSADHSSYSDSAENSPLVQRNSMTPSTYTRPSSLPITTPSVQPRIRILLSPNIDPNPMPSAETTWIHQNDATEYQRNQNQVLSVDTPNYSPPSYDSAVQSQVDLSGQTDDCAVQKETCV